MIFDSIALDMGIKKYGNEFTEHFHYRVVYSAIAMWTLNLANRNALRYPIAKSQHTLLLDNLLNQYICIMPELGAKLSDRYRQDRKIYAHFRNVYEELGAIVNEGNRIFLNESLPNVKLDNGVLQLKEFKTGDEVNGLGIFTYDIDAKVDVFDFLLRDRMSVEKYINAQFSLDEFIDAPEEGKIEYFNPYYNGKNPWLNYMKTECSIARSGPFNGQNYYKVVKDDENIYFCRMQNIMGSNTLEGLDYNRLYVALKAFYKNCAVCKINTIDEEYSMLRLSAGLPNREYFLLLLCSWPMYNAYNTKVFLIKNRWVMTICKMLANIGFRVEV